MTVYVLHCVLSQLISEYNGEDKFMTRIGVGGLINLDRIHQAELLLNDIRLFHQHAATAAAASSAHDASNRPACSDEMHSYDITPDTTAQQSVSPGLPWIWAFLWVWVWDVINPHGLVGILWGFLNRCEIQWRLGNAVDMG